MNKSHRFAFKCTYAEGAIVAFCLNEPGIMTQVNSMAELPEMLKDAVKTYYSDEDLREFVDMPITDEIGKMVDAADHAAFVDDEQDTTFYQVVTVTLEVPADWYRTFVCHGMRDGNVTQFKCLNYEMSPITTQYGSTFAVKNAIEHLWEGMTPEQRKAVVTMTKEQIPADVMESVSSTDTIFEFSLMV